ncbi:hypothetical protein Ddye_024164 [Dipteronia dyeriana]|uniref:Reverse transcriptase domain-containing protein n=1 Tax=Dipteronia dyeriana TaxID=168575 RepID=A0AAD9TUF9_9ROSI|nr:hypothetical protein Ddye_024164 [Dipteronia dyeriana]
MLNGEIHGNIIPSRGIRQGDHLSPYLFLICAKGLSSLIGLAHEQGLLNGFKCSCGGPTISHLFFTDDSLLFSKANDTNCKAVKIVLENYSMASGQLVNFNKSAICVSLSISASEGKRLASIVGVNLVECHEKYLGLPCFTGRSKRKLFTYILGLGENKMVGIEIVIHQCWMGGLGFRDLEIFNSALLAKQCWRIFKNPTSLASRTLKGCYFPNDNLLNATKKSSGSFVWNSLLWGKGILESGLRWRIINGSSIRIYKDNWILRASTFKILSSLTLGELATVDCLLSPSGGWDFDVLNQNFMQNDVDAILQIPIGDGTTHNSIMWHFEGNGCYSVKSGY